MLGFHLFVLLCKALWETVLKALYKNKVIIIIIIIIIITFDQFKAFLLNKSTIFFNPQ